MAKATGLNPDTTYRIFLAASTATGMGDPVFVDSKTSLSGCWCFLSLVYALRSEFEIISVLLFLWVTKDEFF